MYLLFGLSYDFFSNKNTQKFVFSLPWLCFVCTGSDQGAAVCEAKPAGPRPQPPGRHQAGSCQQCRYAARHHRAGVTKSVGFFSSGPQLFTPTLGLLSHTHTDTRINTSYASKNTASIPEMS